MQKISIRLDDKVYAEIEKRRNNVSKSDYYRQIIDYYLRQFDDNQTTSGDNHTITDDRLLMKYEDENQYLRSKLDEALKLVNQSQILQLQAQRALMPEPEKEKPVKKWWLFWK